MRVCAPVCACVGVGVSVGVGVGVSVGVGVWACGCVGVAKTLHPSRGVKSRCKKKLQTVLLYSRTLQCKLSLSHFSLLL